MSSEIAIEIKDVSKCYEIYDKPHQRLLQMIRPGKRKYYREFWAVKDISLTINKGDTVGIIGRNGSGKSTLLQLICQTLKPTTGTITTHGRVAALLELGSGFNPEFTGRENVFLNASLLGLTSKEIHQRFDQIVTFADIGDFVNQPVKTYSSGMMLRLAFAVIAHVDADILIIDEALSVGDAFFSQKCMRFLRDFIKKGTVLFVSHDTSSVKSLCNHAVWLEKGQMQREGTPKEVTELYLEAFYEEQQGKSNLNTIKTSKKTLRSHSPLTTDQRMQFINYSNLRNDLQIFKFNPDAAAFGKGGAEIIDVHLLDENQNLLSWVVGGEKVTLCITAHIKQPLSSPIIGFMIKNRLGQDLFGDNTFLTYSENPIFCEEDSELQAMFSFYMPLLPSGEYSVGVAIAQGTQANHDQHHWIHDSLIFKSESSFVASGLIGIPIQEIKLITCEASFN